MTWVTTARTLWVGDEPVVGLGPMREEPLLRTLRGDRRNSSRDSAGIHRCHRRADCFNLASGIRDASDKRALFEP